MSQGKSAPTGYLKGSNSSGIRPSLHDYRERRRRVIHVVQTLRHAGLYAPLAEVAQQVRTGTFDQPQYEHSFLPLQRWLDSEAPAHERDNLRRSGMLLRMIVEHPEFAAQFVRLSDAGFWCWAAANDGSDLGKIAYPRDVREDHVLYRAGKNPMVDHPEVGALVLEELGFPAERSPRAFLPSRDAYVAPWDIVAGVRYHHEKYNGVGYPAHHHDREIPLVARVIKPADAVETMRSRKGRTLEQVTAELLRCSGTDFDPRIVPIVLEVLPAWWQTMQESR